MSERNKQVTFWGMMPRNPSLGGDPMFKYVRQMITAIFALFIIWGYSLPASAQSVNMAPVIPQSMETTDADLRQLKYELVVGMANVRDGETWEVWMNDFHNLAMTEYGTRNVEDMNLGQVVPVPVHPADWRYRDWELVSYELRPVVAVLHGCEIALGRVDQNSGDLYWATDDAATRGEMFSAMARFVRVMYEVQHSTAVHSLPMCVLSGESFWGDPDMLKDMGNIIISSHLEVQAQIDQMGVTTQELIAQGFDTATATALSADFELEHRFQGRLAQAYTDFNARYDELANQPQQLWIAYAELAQEIAEIRQGQFDAVVAYCAARDDCRGPQGVQGPRGLVGPRGLEGPAGRDADTDAIRTEFERELAALRGNFVTRPEFEQSQATQDDQIAALWVAIGDLRATIESGRASSVSFSGQITAGDALYNADCGLWYSTTDSSQQEVTLATHRSYRGDMSLTFGRYADVEILDYSFPSGWNTGREASQPGLKETRWYAQSPSLDSQVSVTVGNGSGATCTVRWNVFHR